MISFPVGLATHADPPDGRRVRLENAMRHSDQDYEPEIFESRAKPIIVSGNSLTADLSNHTNKKQGESRSQ